MKYIFFASNSVLFRTAIMVYEVTSSITQKRHSPFQETVPGRKVFPNLQDRFDVSLTIRIVVAGSPTSLYNYFHPLTIKLKIALITFSDE
jgi:hypothetical protein